MPELIRAIASRLRELAGNRRRAVRYKARLPITISFSKTKTTGANVISNRPTSSIKGQTRDISATGIGFVLTAIRIGEQYVTDQERTLELALELPDGETLHLRATPVRYEQLDDKADGIGYLIGVRILDGDDQERLKAYLRTL